ncbi:Glucan endo-1,3-beta-glucosidase [Quillaja saponaria]|uniref:glucan endo-1,3-beta-D-glucosidase n=1 Tax=Quillaja saponaria TaxID=32244 RepID=A0AAD7LWV2_QUISA|nr:Glucan endo-1,3-beta-glucosidase [Quillaja saponaria]
MESCWVRGVFVTIITILLIQQLPLARTYVIGVNFGMNGNNLPPATDVIDLYGKCSINFIRIYEPRHDVLEALRGKPFLLSFGTRNEDIHSIAQDQNAANSWVSTDVIPYINDVNIGYITLGNEVIPGAEAPYVSQAINNILKALNDAGVHKDIKVTTVISMAALAASYPPSTGAFTPEAANVLKDIGLTLWHHGSPIMVNVYPYFAYASNPGQISLEYALFKSKNPVVVDGKYNYYNLFDAMVDAIHATFKKIGVPDINIDIAESVWPSAGNEPHTSTENALTYNRNFLNHVLSGAGTPRRPGRSFNAFIFEMFNENLKPAGVEQNFGFFQPNMKPVYPFWP